MGLKLKELGIYYVSACEVVGINRDRVVRNGGKTDSETGVRNTVYADRELRMGKPEGGR